MSENAENIGGRIQCIVTILMQAAILFSAGKHKQALRELKHANIDLAALRVAAERTAGPIKLPPIQRERKKR